jgi:hypothetical protein
MLPTISVGTRMSRFVPRSLPPLARTDGGHADSTEFEAATEKPPPVRVFREFCVVARRTKSGTAAAYRDRITTCTPGKG